MFVVEGFQCVIGIEFSGVKKCLEVKVVGVGVFEQVEDEGVVVMCEDSVIVIIFLNQCFQMFMLVGKCYGMWVDVGGKEGVDCLLVFVELNMVCFIIKIQYCVQGVVIYGFLYYVFWGSCC